MLLAIRESIDLHREKAILQFKTIASNGHYANEIDFDCFQNATIQYLWCTLFCGQGYKTTLQSQNLLFNLQPFIAALNTIAEFSKAAQRSNKH